MDKPIEVFISYSSKDVVIADAICQYLEKRGVSCWIAPRNVRAGMDYGAEINGALKACKVVILIFSKNSNASRDVTNEVNLAFTKGKIIIPFKIEEVEISDSLEYYLGRVHWTNAINNPESHFEKLFEQCSIHTDEIKKTITIQKSDIEFNSNFKLNQPTKENKRSNSNDIIWTDSKSGIFTDPRDNHKYKVVKIGTQIWFAENLAYIPHVSPRHIQGGIWVYDYAGTDVNEAKNSNNYKEYGCLYDWKTASDPNNQICPPGWHLPSDKEWTTLSNYLGGIKVAGSKLKEKDTFHWRAPNKGATNESMFTGLPGGTRGAYGLFYFIGSIGCWWSSTEDRENEAWDRTLEEGFSNMSRGSSDKRCGNSVRCLIKS